MAFLLNSKETVQGIPDTLDGIVKNLRDQARLSTAVTNEFWISQGFINTDLLLFYKNSIVGRIREDAVFVENNDFKQEVYDLLKRTNSSLEVA